MLFLLTTSNLMIILDKVEIRIGFVKFQIEEIRFIRIFIRLIFLRVFAIIFVFHMKYAFLTGLLLFITVLLVFILFMAIVYLFIST